ncbi:hypothetical protein N0V90_002454 [Kalmusia sp. IMI 367209]|nr:hypothetical protein N0V90_002454 [Kalmusia sp. IMI 367209]
MFQHIRIAFRKLNSHHPTTIAVAVAGATAIGLGAADRLRQRLSDRVIPDHDMVTSKHLATANKQLTELMESRDKLIKDQKQKTRYWKQRAQVAEAARRPYPLSAPPRMSPKESRPAVNEAVAWTKAKVEKLSAEKDDGTGPYSSLSTCAPSDLDPIAMGVLPALPTEKEEDVDARENEKKEQGEREDNTEKKQK